ncbi:head-tail adaptor protein [Fusobacterium varium]|uniref:head-tail adaptor protein n=1 Tax=Fusobacterium varium TaxID=856 RepID=UPI0022E45F10|nr:head-tail adaptor protein [Fusobacterium varium]
MSTLASRLQNRIEIWRRKKVSTDIGDSFEPVLFKKVWADIIPLSASTSEGQADTQNSKTKFKVIIRKNDILQSDYLIYKEFKLEIEYIIPSFDRKGYTEIYALLIKE